MGCGILVPQPGIKPSHPALEEWCLNHWAARKVQKVYSSRDLRTSSLILCPNSKQIEK